VRFGVAVGEEEEGKDSACFNNAASGVSTGVQRSLNDDTPFPNPTSTWAGGKVTTYSTTHTTTMFLSHISSLMHYVADI
jgi:hypothetical protein